MANCTLEMLQNLTQFLKTNYYWHEAEEIAWQLRALAVLLKDLDSMTSNSHLNSHCEGSNTFLWPLWALQAYGAQTYSSETLMHIK